MTQMVDTAIVGSGLAGLTAAAYLAQNGRSVLILEKAHQIGGRALSLGASSEKPRFQS